MCDSILKFLVLGCAGMGFLSLGAGEYDDLTSPPQDGVNEITGSTPNKQADAAGFAFNNGRFLSPTSARTAVKPWFVQYHFTDGSAPIVTNYSFSSELVSGTGRMPRDWTFKGSDTGADGDWVVLDERKGVTWSSTSQRQYFPFVNSAAYPYYRLEITANNGDSGYMGLSKIEFYGVNPQGDYFLVAGDPFDCGRADPDFGVYEGLASDGEPIPCSAPEVPQLLGEDRKMTAVKGWTLYEFDDELKAFVVRDASKEDHLSYVHNGKKNKLVWHFEVQCKASVGAAEHGSAVANPEFARDDKYATLTAQADEGYGFAYWTGDVPEVDKYDNPLLLRMEVAKTVTPVFLPAKTVTPDGAETPQQAIDSFGAEGGVVMLSEGIYTYDAVAPAMYLTTPVIVRGAGCDKTVIDGRGCAMRAVTLANANAVVVGVAISNCAGGTSQAGSAAGMGLLVTASGGIFTDGAVVGCTNTSCVGAAAALGGRISHSFIRYNKARSGGGLYLDGNPTVDNCLIADNEANQEGGGVHFFGGMLLNCNVVNNSLLNSSSSWAGAGGFYAPWKEGGAVRYLYNCVFAGNRVNGSASTGSPDWTITSSAAGCSWGIANNAVAVNILNGANGITDPVVFEPGDDWVPTASAVTKDAGTVHELQSSRDLLGNPRVSGAAIDVGCYEADDDVFDCSFLVTPIQSLSNGHVEFLARITGREDDSDLAYVWTIVNKTTGETLEESGKLVSFDAMDEGWYGATVQVFEGGEEIAGYSIDDCLQIFPAQIVLEAGDDVAAAVDRADLGTEIVLGDGSYEVNGPIALTRPTSIVSASGSLASVSVIVTNKAVALSLKHAEARVENVTVRGPVAVSGGTLAGCRVTGCHGDRGQNAPIVAGSGRVTHCIVDRNGVAPDGTISRNTVGGVLLNGSASMDNTLVADNYGGTGSFTTGAGAVYVTATPKMWNCTIAGNDSKGIGGLCVYASTAYDVRNCISAGNTAVSTAGGQPDLHCIGDGDAKFVNRSRQGIVSSHFGLTEARGSVMTKDEVYGEVLFKNPAGGNYRLRTSSCCRDAGVKMADAFEQGTDLDGCPRVFTGDRHPYIDLGCYEAHPAGFSVFLK